MTYKTENSDHLGCTDAAWLGEWGKGDAAAPGSGVQGETKSMDNEYFKWKKKLLFCAQQILNFWTKETEIQQIIVTFLKFVFCVRDGRCDWLPRPSENIATSLLSCIRNVWHHLPNNTASYLRRSVSSVTPQWGPQISQGCFTVTSVWVT
jgi:hypothetical protein